MSPFRSHRRSRRRQQRIARAAVCAVGLGLALVAGAGVAASSAKPAGPGHPPRTTPPDGLGGAQRSLVIASRALRRPAAARVPSAARTARALRELERADRILSGRHWRTRRAAALRRRSLRLHATLLRQAVAARRTAHVRRLSRLELAMGQRLVAAAGRSATTSSAPAVSALRALLRRRDDLPAAVRTLGDRRLARGVAADALRLADRLERSSFSVLPAGSTSLADRALAAAVEADAAATS